jgi:DNA-binding response OmpR family regulator
MILDIRLPGLSGLELCRSLRAQQSRLPVLALTACDSSEDVIAGLDAGADDYLTKPFVFHELLARLRALLRRGSGGSTACLQVADLVLNTAQRSVTRGGRAVELSNMEYRVLEHLVRNRGSVQTKARISAALWADEIGPESNVLEVHIASLRRKLDAGGAARLIHTRRGVGYVVTEDDA